LFELYIAALDGKPEALKRCVRVPDKAVKQALAIGRGLKIPSSAEGVFNRTWFAALCLRSIPSEPYYYTPFRKKILYPADDRCQKQEMAAKKAGQRRTSAHQPSASVDADSKF